MAQVVWQALDAARLTAVPPNKTPSPPQPRRLEHARGDHPGPGENPPTTGRRACRALDTKPPAPSHPLITLHTNLVCGIYGIAPDKLARLDDASPRHPGGLVTSVKHTSSGTGAVSGTAHRIAPGDTVTPRELTTIHSEPILVPATGGLTHLQFRRYAGCPICNVHLRSVARRHDEILAAGIRETVVFHSAVKDMLPYQGELPFAAVADPDKDLYAEFGVESSKRSLLHPKAWTAPLNPQTWSIVVGGIRAGAPLFSTGGQSVLGLPADFLIGADGLVLAAKHGRHANDQWSVDELLRLAHTPLDELAQAGRAAGHRTSPVR